MSKVIQFLDALKCEFPNMFEVKEDAPMPEFWESFEAAYQEAAEQQRAADKGYCDCPPGIAQNTVDGVWVCQGCRRPCRSRWADCSRSEDVLSS